VEEAVEAPVVEVEVEAEATAAVVVMAEPVEEEVAQAGLAQTSAVRA
jgi:hypothetical protein